MRHPTLGCLVGKVSWPSRCPRLQANSDILQRRPFLCHKSAKEKSRLRLGYFQFHSDLPKETLHLLERRGPSLSNQVSAVVSVVVNVIIAKRVHTYQLPSFYEYLSQHHNNNKYDFDRYPSTLTRRRLEYYSSHARTRAQPRIYSLCINYALARRGRTNHVSPP